MYSFFISVITYGYTLTNFSLTIDSETPYFNDFAMGLGRWGSNLIRYKIFDGHLPYFTLLLGLVFLSLSAVQLSKIFKLSGALAFVFCTLFISFPQHSYQLAFNIQADAIPIGFYVTILAVSLFIENIEHFKSKINLFYLICSVLLLVFGIAVYQALVFVPFVAYLVYFFINVNDSNCELKNEIKKLIQFLGLLLISFLIYYISVKLICPVDNSGYLGTYVSGDSNDRFIDFYNLWVDNIRGDFYYGEKTFLFTFLSSLIVIAYCIKEKKHLLLKVSTIFVLLIAPFFISFFITSGANPPRLYVSSPIIYGFFIIYLFKRINIKYEKNYLFVTLMLLLTNIYFVTNLFYSNNKVFKHDVEMAKKIDFKIINKYPEFNSNLDYVYFYGASPTSNYDKLIIPNTDVFSGSFFRWDGGNNWRIINFFRFNDIAYYKGLDSKEAYEKIKDSVTKMPLWPNDNSVLKIDNVVVVKLGDTEGVKLTLN